MFYQSFMGWINYYIKQYTVSLIIHKSCPTSTHFQTLCRHHASFGGDYILTEPFVYRKVGHVYCTSRDLRERERKKPKQNSTRGSVNFNVNLAKPHWRPLFLLKPSFRPPSFTFLPQVNSFLSERFFFPLAFFFFSFFSQTLLNSIDNILCGVLHQQTLFSLLRCVFITGVRRTQPTQSVESLLYLKHHTYPVVPFNTY